MKIIRTQTIVQVPAGDYYLGDPCYSVPDLDWLPLLSSCDYFQGSPVGTLPTGEKVLAFGTKWGDGTYPDNKGHYYDVDAGLIGLVPVTDATTTALGEYSNNLPSIEVTFSHPVECWDDDGVLHFGSYVIDTKSDSYEDDHYDDIDFERDSGDNDDD